MKRAHPRLVSVATALPEHIVRQEDAKAFITALYGREMAPAEQRLFAVFDNVGITRRHICMPFDWYAEEHAFGEKNARYVEHALALSGTVAERALERAGLTPADVDHLVFVSSTGVSTPSLDARLANRLPFRGDFRRTPIWGLGCAGGAAGVARARDFALADPHARVLLVSIELCTLTFQRGEANRQNVVAASLFGDGAAAALVVGAEAELPPRAPVRGLELMASRSTLWPGTLDIMGWEVDEAGLHVVFSRDIPTVVREWVRPNLDAFLADHGMTLADLSHVVAHPGGPKVLAAYAETLGLTNGALRHSHDVLRDCGNMSSPTCLFVLERALAAGDIAAGETAMLAALGPGFSSELVLMRGAEA